MSTPESGTPDRRDRRRQQIIERVVAQLDLPYSFVEREMELEEKLTNKPCDSATLTALVARAAWAKEVWPDDTVEIPSRKETAP